MKKKKSETKLQKCPTFTWQQNLNQEGLSFLKEGIKKLLKSRLYTGADKISISDKELADLFASLAPLKSKLDIYVNYYIFFCVFSFFTHSPFLCFRVTGTECYIKTTQTVVGRFTG